MCWGSDKKLSKSKQKSAPPPSGRTMPGMQMKCYKMMCRLIKILWPFFSWWLALVEYVFWARNVNKTTHLYLPCLCAFVWVLKFFWQIVPTTTGIVKKAVQLYEFLPPRYCTAPSRNWKHSKTKRTFAFLLLPEAAASSPTENLTTKWENTFARRQNPLHTPPTQGTYGGEAKCDNLFW